MIAMPEKAELGARLGIGDDRIADLFDRSLLAPVGEFLSRPSKGFRGSFVELGYRLAAGEPDAATRGRIARMADVLEAVHAGSLVVDDIQDDSAERRGRPTLHREHGVPLALNAGNWLYFWPLHGLSRLGLEPGTELRAYRVCHEQLLRAHYGQALDVGVAIDRLPRARIPMVVEASLALKSGALMEMAVSLGAVLAGAAGDAARAAIGEFGRRFGVALQKFDDTGNARPRRGTQANDGKRFEDLKLRRPSWLWAVAAEALGEEGFGGFLAAVRALPDEGPLDAVLEREDLLGRATAGAERYLDGALAFLADAFGGATDALRMANGLGERLRRAYG